MRHRKARVVMIGACMLIVAVVTGAMANEFYDAGTAADIEGADNFGKTVVHLLVTLGLPALSVGLMGGGLMRIGQHPRQGVAGLATGGAAGWLAGIVKNLHQDAAAAVLGGPLLGGLSVPWVALSLTTQALMLAGIVCYVRRSRRCANAAAVCLTNPS